MSLGISMVMPDTIRVRKEERVRNGEEGSMTNGMGGNYVEG